MSKTAESPPPQAKPDRGPSRPKVPPFARYKNTSVWRKDRKRVRAYARFLAETKQDKQATGQAGA